MKNIFNILLLVSFVFTILVPLTGTQIHKLASTCFLILCFIHTWIYKSKLNKKRGGLLLLILISFLSGLFGMIFDEILILLIFHRVLSIGIIFFLAIHIYIFYKKFR